MIFKTQLLFGLLIFVQISCTTKKNAIDLNENENSNSAIFQMFHKTHDLAISYTCQSYWWSDQFYYDVIAKKGDEWNYYYLSAKKKKNGGWSSIKKRTKSINADLGNLLVNYMHDKGLLNLKNECLNNNKIFVNDSIFEEISISDGVNYKFEIIKNGISKIIEAYEPEYYLEKIPNSNCRKIFLDWKSKFLEVKKEIDI